MNDFKSPVMLGATLVTVLVTGCRSQDLRESELDAVSVFGGTYENIGIDVVRQGEGLVASFHYREGGAKHTYLPMHDAPVTAKSADYGYDLEYLGTYVGQIRHGRLLLCDRYDAAVTGGAGPLDFACNVNFYNPGFSTSPADTSAAPVSAYTMDIALANPPAARGLNLTTGRLTLESYAQNQINQYGTATCAYNAATGIMEILYAMSAGRLENFSEPYYLIRSPKFTGQTDWFWTMYEKVGTESAGMLQDSLLPVTSVYRPGRGFGGAESAAESLLKNQQVQPVKPVSPMRGEKIFFHAEWSGGRMRAGGKATDADYEAMVAWFNRNVKPVNLHYWINGIWHSVIMIGHDQASDTILVKDSLGNTHIKGSWKSRSWFRNNAYAAIGVTMASAIPMPEPLPGGTVPDPGVGPVPNPGDGPVPEPGVLPDMDSADALAKRLTVQLKLGGVEGRYRVFTLVMAGAPADLDRIVEVRYEIHPTFGQAATRTVSDRTSSFELGKYLTYARGWRTGGTVVKVKVNGGVQEVRLPGTLISW